MTCKSTVSDEQVVAVLRETVIGGTAEHWLRLQAAHDIAALRMRAGEITAGLTRLAPPAEGVPARD